MSCEEGDIIVLAAADFRKTFPNFSDVEKYPDDIIQAFLEQVCAYASVKKCQPFLQMPECSRKLALLNVAAHLLLIYINTTGNGTNAGGIGAFLGSTQIGEVSVSMYNPSGSKLYQDWYNQTPYGKAFLSIMRARAPIGFYYGGSNQRVFIGNNRNAR